VIPCPESGRVYLIDRVTLELWDALEAGPNLTAFVLDASRRMAIATHADGQVDRIEIGSAHRTTIDLSSPSTLMAPAADGSVVMLSREGSTLFTLDRATSRPLWNMPPVAEPLALALWPTGTPVMRMLPVSLPALDPPQPRGR
jgi:hypothetical protein